MKICEKLKSIFKSSSESGKKDNKDFLITLKQDIQNAKLPPEEFEKKFKKLIDNRIKKIPSMSEKNKETENEMISLAYQIFSDFEQIYQVAPPIATKIKILRPYLKNYQDEIRKSIKKD